MKYKSITIAISALIFLAASAAAQTGGAFTIEKSVIASGGAQNLAGGSFSLDGTIGQPLAGLGAGHHVARHALVGAGGL